MDFNSWYIIESKIMCLLFGHSSLELKVFQERGVPRVYEKIMEGMLAKGREIKGLKKKISQECKKAGLEFHLHGRKSLMYR